MTAQPKIAVIPIKPIYSGPRPNIDRQCYEKQCRYLEQLAQTFDRYLYSPKEEPDQRIHQLFEEAKELHKCCEAFAQKARDLKAELALEVGEYR